MTVSELKELLRAVPDDYQCTYLLHVAVGSHEDTIGSDIKESDIDINNYNKVVYFGV